MILSDSISNKTKDMEKLSGYFNMYWDSSSGKLWLEINDFDKEFLYVNSLTAGIGSNDIGLDRGQLGNERIVFFAEDVGNIKVNRSMHIIGQSTI